MISRFLSALFAFMLLISFVFLGQRRLTAVSDELCALAHEASVCFSEDRIADGAVALSRLEEMLDRHDLFLAAMINDSRLHEIHRALNRARVLSSAGDPSPVLEALADLSRTLSESAQTHLPTWANIL